MYLQIPENYREAVFLSNKLAKGLNVIRFVSLEKPSHLLYDFRNNRCNMKADVSNIII